MISETGNGNVLGTIKITHALLLAFGAALVGLGSGFMIFYSTVCYPQIKDSQNSRDQLILHIDGLEKAIQENTLATNNLVRELKKQ